MKISLKVKNPKQPKNQSRNLVFYYFLLNLFLFTSTAMLQVHFGFILWNWSLSTQGTNWDIAKTWEMMSIVLFFFLKEKAVWGGSCGLGKLAVVCATCQILSPNLHRGAGSCAWDGNARIHLVLSSSWDTKITLTNCPFLWACSASDYWAIHARSWTRGDSSATQSSPLAVSWDVSPPFVPIYSFVALFWWYLTHRVHI